LQPLVLSDHSLIDHFEPRGRQRGIHHLSHAPSLECISANAPAHLPGAGCSKNRWQGYDWFLAMLAGMALTFRKNVRDRPDKASSLWVPWLMRSAGPVARGVPNALWRAAQVHLQASRQ
jgi:hypothetical protein